MNKKSFFIISAFLLASFFISSCGEKTADTKTTTETSDSAKVVYTCPMHPEVISNKPGKCPKCGMDLVIKK
jgi:hypothetical protein